MASDRQQALRHIRLVLTDVDGVLTDGGVYYSERGEELKRFDLRDGMGVSRLRDAGLECGIVTGEDSPIVQRRAAKLGIDELHLGIADKSAVLDRILERRGLTAAQVAYIGDDVNDAAVMSRVGFTGAPADAQPGIVALADHVCNAPGGHGAFREFIELILAAQSGAAANRSHGGTACRAPA
ncbi:MAG: HAD family hydrolase [bacterium]|nr:HAD family hydrolase [bacterium]